jgi:hypothetical protein
MEQFDSKRFIEGILEEAEEWKKQWRMSIDEIYALRGKPSIFQQILLHHDPSEFRPWYRGLIKEHPEWKFVETITEREARQKVRRGKSIENFRILKRQYKYFGGKQHGWKYGDGEIPRGSTGFFKGGRVR